MIRSPLFYVGDKYKLVPQLLKLFPKNIDTYVEAFYGGGSSQLQVNAKQYFLNDIDSYVIKLHEFLFSYVDNRELFFKRIFSLIKKYGLSCSYLGIEAPQELKRKYKKTYYSVYNKKAYSVIKKEFNDNGCKDMMLLYVLLIYGFNHMIRFNSQGEFNLPVGNVDFNKNVYDAINNYFDLQKNRTITFFNEDFEKFLSSIKIGEGTFLYFDPPYLISMSEYNKFWNEEEEQRLYDVIDSVAKKGCKFGITNLLKHKGKTNKIFDAWSKKYKIEIIKSNYISFNDNTIKEDSVELYVHN